MLGLKLIHVIEGLVNWNFIDSGNGSSPVWYQAITRANANTLWIEHSITHFDQIRIKI